MKTKLFFLMLFCSVLTFAQKAHNDDVESLNFSTDGKYLISASADGTVKVWDVQTRKFVKSIPVEGAAVFASFTNDNKQIVTASQGNVGLLVKVWDMETGNEVRTIENEEDPTYYQCAYDPRGKYLVTGSKSKRLIVFDIETGERVRYLDFGGDMHLLRFTSGGYYILAKSISREVFMYDTPSWTLTKPTNAKPCMIGFSGDGNWVAYFTFYGTTLGDNNTMYVVNAKTKATNNYASESSCNNVTFMNTQPIIATTFDNGKFIIYNLENGKKIKALKGHESEIKSLAFSTDGKYLVSGGGKNASTNDCSIHIWDTEKWKEIGTFVQ